MNHHYRYAHEKQLKLCSLQEQRIGLASTGRLILALYTMIKGVFLIIFYCIHLIIPVAGKQ